MLFRSVACVSSQVGCAMGCVFCATGRMGLGRATHMEQEFTQTGVIRYGESYWYATNLTTPFALLRVSKDAIILSASVLRAGDCTFTFPRSAIRRLRWKRGLLSRGLQIEHTVGEYPPFVLFWVGYRKTVAEGLRAFGYEISDGKSPA